MAQDKTQRQIFIIMLVTAAALMAYIFFIMMPEIRAENLRYKGKCEDAKGEVIYIQGAGKRCIRPDTFIEIE